MPTADDIYIHCDELENIPKLCRENWEYEIELLSNILPQGARVLQVGCMDGTRIITLLQKRPNLRITGVDIEENMVKRCTENVQKYGFQADVILGDITKPLPVSDFDVVCCLNNTLGYIDDQRSAITNMKSLGKTVILSVFGENFGDDLAREYFHSIGLDVTRIEDNNFHFDDFVNASRYTRDDVEQWNGEITETPLGYFCTIRGTVV